MEIFKSTNFNFIGNRTKAFTFSGILLAATVISLVLNRGLNLSIDFAGGTVVQLAFEKSVMDELSEIREIVNGLDLGKPEVKTIGAAGDNEIQITVKRRDLKGSGVADQIKKALSEQYAGNPFDLRREEKVGPRIGSELQGKAFIAGILSLLAIVVYIGIRFHFPFGIAAIVALFHDVLITIGFFAAVDLIPGFEAEFSLPIVAALLTIIGYSLNDTIVVFDRIRENLGGSLARKSFEDKLNTSINQCLSRTAITSFTTFIVVLSVFITFLNSGNVIKDFSMALLVGVVVGTYSSVFVASPVLVLWNKKWPIR